VTGKILAKEPNGSRYGHCLITDQVLNGKAGRKNALKPGNFGVHAP
jgi:hypothetical protein